MERTDNPESAEASFRIAEAGEEEIIDLDIHMAEAGGGTRLFHATAYVYPKPPYDGRPIPTWLTGLPWGTKAVSVWATENFGTEQDGSEPHAGRAIFYTHSVQLAGGGSLCRVIWSVIWPESGEATIPASLVMMGLAEDWEGRSK